jgi:hypothetical protein
MTTVKVAGIVWVVNTLVCEFRMQRGAERMRVLYLFIYGLFYDTVSFLGCIAPVGMTTDE